jgi:hypothetical protein
MRDRTGPQPQSARLEPAGRCVVCLGEIEPGGGHIAGYASRRFRFRCADCYERFAADPDAFLTRHDGECCRDDTSPPMSEWACY